MKKLLSLLVAFVFVLCLAATPAVAFDLSHSFDKVKTGMTDILKSPLHIINHPKAEMESHDHKVVGLFKGTLEMPFKVVKDVGGGALDIVTFPVK